MKNCTNPSTMIFVASSCLILIISFILTSNCTQAIYLTSSIPADLPGFTTYDVKNFASKLSNQTNTTEMSKTLETTDEQTIYVIEFESELDEKNNEKTSRTDNDIQSPWDPWSIVWYIGSFGGLVAFFLIVSCSEWFCRRNSQPINTGYSEQRNGETVINTSQIVNENPPPPPPPPPYHLFAPPSYDSINYNDLIDKTTGGKVNIYVISIPFQDFQGTAQPAPA